MAGRREFLTRGDCESISLFEGMTLRVFANGEKGAEQLTTCEATLAPGAGLPYHTHPTGEAITLLSGSGIALVEGRRYAMRPFDCVYVPAEVAHGVQNESDAPILLHTSFPTATVEREFVDDTFTAEDRDAPGVDHPETLVRFAQAETYELCGATVVRDLFAGRLGAQGVCGGHGHFPPGSGLPCHTHEYDESITIVRGKAVCLAAGRRYELSGNDTVCIPRGVPHRFLNETDDVMEMIWVYAGDEPDRQLEDAKCCEPE